MALQKYIRRELILVRDEGASRDELFHLFALAVQAVQPALDGETLMRLLIQREAQSPTSTPEGVAFPHALAPDIAETYVALARVADGVDFGVPGHGPCDLVFCMFGNSEKPWEHVRILARLARLVHTTDARHNLRIAKDASDLYGRLMDEDRSHE